MKQFFSQALASFGQRRPRITWLAVLPLTLSLLLVCIPTTSPVFAATTSHPASNLAATQLLSSIKLAQVDQPLDDLETSTDLSSSSQSSDGTLCKTFTSYLSYGYLGVKNEMWLKVVTTWCYSGGKDTSHKTVIYWGVTSAGAGSGWTWPTVSPPSYSFKCGYQPNPPSTIPCSSNWEHVTQLFQNPFLRDEASLTIDQFEYANGTAANLFNAHICPGGCS